MNKNTYYKSVKDDLRDPDPFYAMYLDSSIPFDNNAKNAFLKDSSSFSRRALLPIVKVLARAFRMIVILYRIIFPKLFSMPKFLHWQLYIGQKYLLTPEANYLILRHFCIGSEILSFIATNVDCPETKNKPLKPLKLTDIKNNVYLQHDLNLFNFIIALNKSLRDKGRIIEFKSLDQINFEDISLEEFSFDKFPNRFCNFIDLATAIEIFSPIFQLYLTNNDHERAVSSLQFDETIGIYVATLLGIPEKLVLVNNRHPMIPLSPIKSGFRLLLHGLSTEVLHGLLKQMKQKQLNFKNAEI
tara:strand:- start:1114 stop:2013 length:900 start_codon:yes stop_codon:yes gene_type:complete